MTYVIVTAKDTVIGSPFAAFDKALAEANILFGDDVAKWIAHNVRVEENR